MARTRSPNYPAISLKEAVERIGLLFKSEQRHSAPKEVVAKGMGFGGVNGASLSAISAALKFGLLEKSGEDFKVTDAAIEILHPHNADEKSTALLKAAFAPRLFAELVEHYNGDLPSDENLRAYLIRKGFGQNALTGVIQSYRETMELVGGLPKGYVPPKSNLEEDDEDDNEDAGAMMAEPSPQQRAPKTPTANTVSPPLRVSIVGDHLEVTAVLTDSEAVDRLISILTANRSLLPKKQ